MNPDPTRVTRNTQDLKRGDRVNLFVPPGTDPVHINIVRNAIDGDRITIESPRTVTITRRGARPGSHNARRL
jgi:hypothetical protein